MRAPVARHLFTVTEYERMGEAGILSEDDRVELIEGEIVEMSPIGIRHVACVSQLAELLIRHLVPRVTVNVQSPMRLTDRSEPQPDLLILHRRNDFYRQALPVPEDVFFLIEVADSTLDSDRQVKIPLYAQTGIAEIWLVNLPNDTIEVYTQPIGDSYQTVRVVKRGESFAPSAFPELGLSAAEILS